MPDIYRALGLLDWSAPGARELVALGNQHVAGNVQAPRFILGEFHPARGPEILRISGTLLRAFTLDGRQLWERPVSHGEYFRVQLAEGECVGSICPPLAVMEFSASGQASYLSVLNGVDGSSTWDSPASTEGLALHALTDVSGDNLPELIVVAGPTRTQRLRALDARNSAT